MSEKNQDATPKQIRDARRRGQVAQSQDLPKLLILVVVSEITLGMADVSMQKLQALIELSVTRMDQPFLRTVGEVTSQGAWLVASFAVLSVGVAMLMRLLGSWMQFGLLFAPEALKPSMEKLNPFSHLKQMFTLRSLITSLSGVVKAAIIATAMWLIVEPALGTLISLVHSDLVTFWHALATLFQRILRVTCGLLLVLAAADFAIQKYFHAKQLRMSMEDIKQEYKNSEGNPEVKGHRRQLAHELLNEAPKPPAKPVKDADVLIVNPTHYAVALYYRPEETALPRIHCKHLDAGALALIEAARREGIPVVQCVWLARTLYRVPEGRFIPRDTLQAVAQIYGVIKQLDDDAKREVIQANDIDIF
ncbi:type III secretion system export apparatus subunit SctU [Pseudomonas sp. nanlin1]|uniref:type III secretion system export apparatus subunit SctU n=1 Tax=Pseudomonas sp. nanlin1 TaxID=3040605 RepID=UPI00388CFF07